MPVETPSLFARVIQDHLELKRRNSDLEPAMPIEGYRIDDPFDNHPLFKTEEQARVEDTLDGVQSIDDQPTMLDWPTSDELFAATMVATAVEPAAAEEQSDETLWTRSRDFDWGD
jgi:hypothetical protein